MKYPSNKNKIYNNNNNNKLSITIIKFIHQSNNYKNNFNFNKSNSKFQLNSKQLNRILIILIVKIKFRCKLGTLKKQNKIQRKITKITIKNRKKEIK